MDLWCIYIPLPLFWQAQKSQPLMRMLAMCFSNGRQNPNNVYWEHIFCQISDNIYWEHIFCQNPNNVYWEHNKWSPESQQCLLRTQQIHGACEYTVDKYSTARNWWQNWLKFCCPVKLFVRKASPLAYVSFSQQSTAEKHRTLFVCLAQWPPLPGRPLITVLSSSEREKERDKKKFPNMLTKVPSNGQFDNANCWEGQSDHSQEKYIWFRLFQDTFCTVRGQFPLNPFLNAIASPSTYLPDWVSHWWVGDVLGNRIHLLCELVFQSLPWAYWHWIGFPWAWTFQEVGLKLTLLVFWFIQRPSIRRYVLHQMYLCKRCQVLRYLHCIRM